MSPERLTIGRMLATVQHFEAAHSPFGAFLASYYAPFGSSGSRYFGTREMAVAWLTQRASDYGIGGVS